MKRISSITTYFRKKIIPIILLINILIIICCLSFYNYTVKNLSLLIGSTIIFIYAWLSSFRKLEIVYLGNKYLEVNKEKILFKNIISIEKISSFCYKLTYQKNDTTNFFIFMVDSLPFVVPNYIKEIREFIKKNDTILKSKPS